ncbi:MAG: cupin domain-containing protein, partial [Candidatus Diapherotrites archaeon]|nr:cupin domain-containing protein [Candidatus Diapherotrites archaeon]
MAHEFDTTTLRRMMTMHGYTGNIERLTLDNEAFRKVLFTGKKLQLVVMSLLPNEEIGLETHAHTDQFFRVEAGEAVVIMNGVEHRVGEDHVAVVPAGTEHNVINRGKNTLK